MGDVVVDGEHRERGEAMSQDRLYDQVTTDSTGRDLRDVLREAPGSPADKRAVADRLGGTGAGDRDFPEESVRR